MLPRIQILRAAAALMVLGFHSAYLIADTPLRPIAEVLWRIGFAGVDVFFTISGFILAHTFFKEPGQPRTAFLLKRFLRVYTGYWPAFALCIGLFALQGRPLGGYDLGSAALLIPQDVARTPLPIVWTLYHELYYYLIFALLACLPKRWMALGLMAYAALVAGVQASFWWHGYYTTGQRWVGLPTNDLPVAFFVVSPYVLEFIAGTLLAFGLESGRLRLAPVSALQLAVTGLVLALCLNASTYHGELMGGVFNLQRVLWLLPPAGLLVYWAVRQDQAQAPVSFGAELVALGNASYSLFLLHLPLLKTLDKAIIPLRSSPGAMLMIASLWFPFVIALSLVWQEGVEAPLYQRSWEQMKRRRGNTLSH